MPQKVNSFGRDIKRSVTSKIETEQKKDHFVAKFSQPGGENQKSQ